MKRKRLTSRTVDEKSSTVIFTFEQAYEYFLSSKKAEELRKPTLTGYHEHFNFFIKWLNEYHPEIKTIDELTFPTIRLYVN